MLSVHGYVDFVLICVCLVSFVVCVILVYVFNNLIFLSCYFSLFVSFVLSFPDLVCDYLVLFFFFFFFKQKTAYEMRISDWSSDVCSSDLGQSGGRRWYLRRLAVLFLIGLLHSAFWWGDILRSYAVAGLLLLPLARMRPRNLAILGVALMYLPHLPWWQGASSLAPRAHAYAAALVAFSSAHAATMLRGNHAFDLWWWQSHWSVPASLPGLMLIGLALGNSQVLRDPDRHAGFWNWLLACLPVGLVLALLVTLSDYGRLGRFGDATAPWRHALDQGIVLLVAPGFAALTADLQSVALGKSVSVIVELVGIWIITYKK